jgi:hypothetical protein
MGGAKPEQMMKRITGMALAAVLAAGVAAARGQAGSTVWLRGGTYWMDKTLVLTPADPCPRDRTTPSNDRDQVIQKDKQCPGLLISNAPTRRQRQLSR